MTDYNSEDFWKGAPEGATHYLPADAKRSWVACWYKQNSLGQWLGFNAENYYRGIRDEWTVDNDQVEAFTAALIRRSSCAKPEPCPGDSLPPVGTECEVLNNDLSNAAWEKCTILFSGKHRIVYDSESCSERVGYRNCLQFRPIKTTAQIAAEEREAAIDEIDALISSRMGSLNVRELAMAIHDAGYRLKEGDDK